MRWRHTNRLARCARIITCAFLLWGVAGQTFAQVEPRPQAKPKSFADYPADSAAYLLRLHNKNEEHSRLAALAYREDFPGGFEAWRLAARKRLKTLIGIDQMILDVGTHLPHVQLGAPIQEAGYQRRLGRIETEPNVTIPFWLLIPDDKRNGGLRPLVICSHGHDADGWNTYAGVFRDKSHRQQTLAKQGDVGVQAVKSGYIAIVPATRGLAQAASIPDLKGRHGKRACRAQLIHCLLAGRTAVGERVWDVQRVLDWALNNVKGVDPKRIAMLGNSGGGVLTVYVAALDERIRVAAPSCSFSSYTSSSGFIFHCDCCLVPRAQIELGDMADVGALTAPRRLLAVHGRKDGLHSQQDVEAAMKRVAMIFTAAKAREHFHFQWGDEGHKFYPQIMWPFIENGLKE